MKVGRFTLLEPLASGAAGTVWRARHDSGHPAAVKWLDAPGTQARFELELQAICELHHPNIVQVFDAGEAQERPWLAMELMEGGPLHHAPLPSWERRSAVLVGLLSALAHAHAAGLVHLDVKPPNLLFDRDGVLKLADFGVASTIGRSPERIVGTPAFMAPEQLTRGARLGPWTDLYAVGMLGWWLACGRLPWSHTDPRALMRAQRHEALPAFQPQLGVPGGLEGWLRSLLDKRPEARPQHAQRALDSLPGATRRRAEEGPSPSPGAGLVALRSPPFVGREPERRRIEEELARAIHERSVRALVLTGAGGVGKTRLAQWALRRARELGQAEGLTVHGGRLREALAQAHRRRAAGVELDLEAERPPGRFLDELRSWARGPLLLHLDDPRPEELALAEALLDLDEGPALLLITLRSEALARHEQLAHALGTLRQREDCTPIELAPLDEAANLKLARHLLDLDEGSLVDLARRSGGNPLLLEQLVSHGVARGQLEAGPWGHRLRPGVRLELPEDLRAGLLVQVDALLPEERDALLLGALLDHHVDGATWGAACSALGVPASTDLLRRLERQALVQRRGSGWHITHGLLREALLEQVEGRRPDLYAACAAALAELGADPAQRARMLVGAGLHEEALPLLERAIQACGEAAGPRRELVGLLRRANEALGRDDEVTHILMDLHELRVLVVEGREDLAVPRIRALIPRARSEGMGAAVIELSIQAGRAALDAGRPDLAREQLHHAVHRARSEAPQLLTWAAHQAAWAECVLGEPEEALALAEEVSERGERPVLRAHLQAMCGYAHSMAGRPETGAELVREARSWIQALGQEQERIRMDTHLVLIEAISDRRGAALARARQLLEDCRIGRLRQHLLAMVLSLQLGEGRRPGQAELALRIARNRWQTWDVRLQASGCLLSLGRAEEPELQLLERGCSMVVDPILLHALEAGHAPRARRWARAIRSRLHTARS